MASLSVRLRIAPHLALVFGASLGCGGPNSNPDARQISPVTHGNVEHQTTPFDRTLKDIAQTYRDFERVSSVPRVSRIDCDRPYQSILSPTPMKSAAPAGTPHGTKYYFVFAKFPDRYAPLAAYQDVGQILVKEAWPSREVADGTTTHPRVAPHTEQNSVNGELPGHASAGRPELFILLKLDPDTPGTDEGWVYATVAPTGPSVTSAGRVGTCMECHQQAPNDRVFGLAAK